jgi:hypothetical protein
MNPLSEQSDRKNDPEKPKLALLASLAPVARLMLVSSCKLTAGELFSFAIPILILQHAGVFWALVHNMLRNYAHSFCVLVLFRKMPLKGLLSIGLILSAAPLVLLISQAWTPTAIVMAALFFGMAEAAWWLWYHRTNWRLTHSDSDTRIGQVSVTVHVMAALATAAPLLAACLIQIGGPVVLLAIAACALTSAWVLGRNLHLRPANTSLVGDQTPTKVDRRDIDLMYLSFGFLISGWECLWPIALFVVLGSLMAVGGTMTGASLLVVVLSSFGLTKALQVKAKTTIGLAALLVTSIACVRAFEVTVILVLATQLLMDVGSRALVIRIDQLSYQFADASGEKEIVRREVLINFGVACSVALALLCYRFFDCAVLHSYAVSLCAGAAISYWVLKELSINYQPIEAGVPVKTSANEFPQPLE